MKISMFVAAGVIAVGLGAAVYASTVNQRSVTNDINMCRAAIDEQQRTGKPVAGDVFEKLMLDQGYDDARQNVGYAVCVSYMQGYMDGFSAGKGLNPWKAT